MILIDKIERNFKERPLTTVIVGTISASVLLEILKFIYSFMAGYNLKPMLFWLVETNITINIVILIILSFFSLLFFVFYVFHLNNVNVFKRINQQNISKFQLTKQSPDDDCYSKILMLDTYFYEIVFKPDSETNYWRYGIKFSHSSDISNERLTNGNPLFHLTKWGEKTSVGATYYNEKKVNLTNGDIPIIQDYNKESIKIKINSISNKIFIQIIDNGKNEIYKYELDKYEYAKISAWGDGNNFQFNCEIKEIKKAI
jgi:hypothetical protein